MKVTILFFDRDKNLVDFRVDYEVGKWEIFRDIRLFIKQRQDNTVSKWLNIWATKREEKWVSRYERSTPTTAIFKEALNELEIYLNNQNNDNVFKQLEMDGKQEVKMDRNVLLHNSKPVEDKNCFAPENNMKPETGNEEIDW